MARILGVDLPREKRVEAGLTAIFGIGPTRARRICEQTGVNPDTRIRDLNDNQVNQLQANIQTNYKVEGDLRRELQSNIKRLMDINCYRGTRHKKGLPTRGQRTRTNARTRKGPRKIAQKRK
jgi:small subunit ribosomal protein S13